MTDLALAIIDRMTNVVRDHADELVDLDRRIGDADHGVNLMRGFEAVRAERETIAARTLPDASIAIGRILVMKVGGASGPLFGTFFMEFGKHLDPAPTRANVAAAFSRARDAVAARGKSAAGQKTLIDVLDPVAARIEAGADFAGIVGAAHAAAESTVPMRAIRGRASFLGDRSIGHMDPGARSASLLIAAVCELLRESDA